MRLPPGAYQGEHRAVDLAGDVARVLLRGRQQRLREAEPRAGQPRADSVVGVVGILEVFCATPTTRIRFLSQRALLSTCELQSG